MSGWEGCPAPPLKKTLNEGLIYWRLIAACHCHRRPKQTLSGSHGFLRHTNQRSVCKGASGRGGHVLLASIPSLSVVVKTKHQPRPRHCQDQRVTRSTLDQKSQVKSGLETKIQSAIYNTTASLIDGNAAKTFTFPEVEKWTKFTIVSFHPRGAGNRQQYLVSVCLTVVWDPPGG